MSKSHHDYIAKRVAEKTVLIRDFEGMYKNIEDPHGQTISSQNNSHNFYLELIRTVLDRRREGSYLDIGCGLGYFTNRLSEVLGDGWSCTGTDISGTAISKAGSNYPDIRFKEHSILNKDSKDLLGEFDLITCLETLYYFEDKEIKDVIENIISLLRPQGIIAVSYHLPEKMGYGRYIRNMEDLVKHFDSLEVLWSMDFTDNLSRIYDGSSFGRHIFAIFRKN